MKCLTLLLLFTTNLLYSQSNVKSAPKFISFKHSRFSIGVSAEFVPVGTLMFNSSTVGNLKIIYKDLKKNQSLIPYYSAGLVFDLYSANSVIGILGGLDFSQSQLGLMRKDSITDFLVANRVEIPLYLKFRTGHVDSKTHLLLLLGGIYNLSQTCKRDQFDATKGELAYAIYSDENKEQLNNYFSLAGSLGYEFFFGEKKQYRIAAYSKFVYPLDNEFNSNYSDFKSTGRSVLRDYSNFSIKEYRVSFGLRFMFQFGEALGIMADAIAK